MKVKVFKMAHSEKSFSGPVSRVHYQRRPLLPVPSGHNFSIISKSKSIYVHVLFFFILLKQELVIHIVLILLCLLTAYFRDYSLFMCIVLPHSSLQLYSIP